MITKIEVDGFKSLKDFILSFEKGLNVLVGPNGSGKTNIVSFFEFLSYLMEVDASEATSRAGGAGAVFRRVGNAYEKSIKARVYGCVSLNTELRINKKKDFNEKLNFCIYDYSFSLVFPESRDSVLFDSQRLLLKRVEGFSDPSKIEKIDWGIDLHAEYSVDSSAKVTINALDDSFIELPYYPILRKNTDGSRLTPQEIIGQMLTENNMSIVAIVSRYTPELWPLVRDFTGGQIYNIVPSKLKLPEDSAKPPGIARDGSGLASTIYALQKSKEPHEFSPWTYHPVISGNNNHNGLNRLKSYLNLVNESVSNIEVENDPFDNQLRVKFTINSGDYSAKLPMTLMSDGTLKWLAIITAAITASSVFCIEEPENYLHPQMQGQIINILREILFDENINKFTLMTTHSETLLNHCLPKELIIVSMNDGKTEAKRCTNASDISDEISRTGFGLGYYYISDAIQND